MRSARFMFVLATAVSTFSMFSTQANAQQAMKRPACDGPYIVIRVSEVKDGMMQKFLDAVNAQREWYKKAGTSDVVTLMKIADQQTGDYSKTMMLTSHVEGHTNPAHDAGYVAFVAMFRASSTIKSEYYTCEVK